MKNIYLSLFWGEHLTLNDAQSVHVFNKGQTAYVHIGATFGWSTTQGKPQEIFSREKVEEYECLERHKL